jgi:transcriptional regulator with XRE-family HTH domain
LVLLSIGGMNILKMLREEKGFSQGELANRLGISRQTVAKYEKSNGKLPANIIKNLSDIFEIGPDVFIAGVSPRNPKCDIIPPEKTGERDGEMRVDVPQKNIDKFKEVLLYVLKKVGNYPNVGQTVIYKLLYFIDFDFYELYEEQLTGAVYMKNVHGPTPVDFAKVVKNMERNGELAEFKVVYHGNEQTKYSPLRLPDLSYFSATELDHVNKELEKHGDKSASQLSELSHRDIPWIAARERGIIPYEAVFYRTPETSVRDYRE